MAVSKIKRLNITAYLPLKDDVLAYLQNAECADIITQENEDERLEYGENELESIIRREFQNIQDIKESIELLEEYVKKGSFIERLKPQEIELTPDEFTEIKEDLSITEDIIAVLNLKNKLAETESTLLLNSIHKAELEKWANLDIPINLISSLDKADAQMGIIPAVRFAEFEEAFKEVSDSASFEIVNKNEKAVYMSVVWLKEAAEKVSSLLSASGFEPAVLPESDKTPSELIEDADKERKCLIREKESAISSLKELAQHITRLKALCDHRSSRYDRLLVKREVGSTDRTFRLKCWVPEDEVDHISAHLEAMGPVSVTAFSPEDGHGPAPVLLKNKGIFNTFQLVTELYGLPRYGEVDPTKFLSPFFFLFFGLCLSDAGYGIMLVAGMVVAMHMLGIKGKIYSLFFWGGIATILGGAITGSWFGVNVIELPESHWASFLASFTLFDPLGTEAQPFFGLKLEGTMAFFYLSIALGYFQICFGTVISGVIKFKDKLTASAIFDDGAWLLAYAGLAMFILSQENVVGMPCYGWAALKTPGLICLGIGMASRLFLYPIFHVILEKEKKSVGSVFAVTGISLILILDNTKNLLGNVLSYCRLMALGMATGVIGSIVNMLAFRVEDAISAYVPVVGIIVMVVMMTGGHVINLLINLLGSFVHTARLQYVEFFPYFFKGGGEGFKPFGHSYRFVKIQE